MGLVASSEDCCYLGITSRENLLMLSSKLGNLLGVVLLETSLRRNEVLLSVLHLLELAQKIVVLVLSGEEFGSKSVELGGDVEGLEGRLQRQDPRCEWGHRVRTHLISRKSNDVRVLPSDLLDLGIHRVDGLLMGRLLLGHRPEGEEATESFLVFSSSRWLSDSPHELFKPPVVILLLLSRCRAILRRRRLIRDNGDRPSERRVRHRERSNLSRWGPGDGRHEMNLVFLWWKSDGSVGGLPSVRLGVRDAASVRASVRPKAEGRASRGQDVEADVLLELVDLLLAKF